MRLLRVAPLALAVPLSAALGADFASSDGLEVQARSVRVLVDGPLVSADVETRIADRIGEGGQAVLDAALPAAAALSGLAVRGPSGEVEGELIARARAEEVFSDVSGVDVRPKEETVEEPKLLVTGRPDPALLETTSGRAVKLHVTPVAKFGEKRIGLRWAAPLAFEDGEARLTVPLRTKGTPVSAFAKLHAEVVIHSPVPIEDVRCTSHEARVETIEPGATYKLTVDGKGIQRDLEVRYRLATTETCAMLSGSKGETLLTLVPRFEGPRAARPLTFAVEASDNTEEDDVLSALDAGFASLDATERFQVVAFGLAARSCFAEPALATAENKARARDFVKKARFDHEPDIRNAFARVAGGDVLLLASRELSEKEDLIAKAQESLRAANARVFACELGKTTLSRPVDALARATGGLASHDVKELLAARRTPVLHDLTLEVPGFERIGALPGSVRSGSSLTLVGRAARAPREALLAGKLDDGSPFRMKVALEAAGAEPVVSRLAAQARVQALRADMARDGRDLAARARLEKAIETAEIEGQVLGPRASLIVLEDDAMFEAKGIARTNRDRIRAERAAEEARIHALSVDGAAP